MMSGNALESRGGTVLQHTPRPTDWDFRPFHEHQHLPRETPETNNKKIGGDVLLTAYVSYPAGFPNALDLRGRVHGDGIASPPPLASLLTHGTS